MVTLKLAIFRFLRKRRNGRLRFWDLAEELERNLRVPEKLRSAFLKDYKEAIDQLHNDQVVYKAYTFNEGGVVIYPYKSGRKSVAQRAAADQAAFKLIQAVQYG